MGTIYIRFPFNKRDFQCFPASERHREYKYSEKEEMASKQWQVTIVVVTMDIAKAD